MNTGKIIIASQRAKIFALCRELGMSTHSQSRDDDLHIMLLGLVEKDSLKELSFDEAGKVIRELQHRQRFGSTPKPKKPGAVSEGQKRKVIALMCELRKLDTEPVKATIERRVAGIIRRELKIDATSRDPYAWLDYQDGKKLIEVIKGYLSTAKRRAESRGDTG
ncbi:MAG: regulatory protein GemA [Oscillospiraceae bacterium]